MHLADVAATVCAHVVCVWTSVHENGRIPAVCCALSRCTCTLCLIRSMCPFLFKPERGGLQRDALTREDAKSRGDAYNSQLLFSKRGNNVPSLVGDYAFTWVFDTTSMLNWFDWLVNCLAGFEAYRYIIRVIILGLA